MADPSKLSNRDADGSAGWDALPAGTSVVQVAHEYLQVLVIDRLKGQGVRPRDLAECLGGSPTLWRLKLKGERRLTLDDILGLLAAVDLSITDGSPLTPQAIADMVPPDYRDWLVSATQPLHLPRFLHPSGDAHWAPVATRIDGWWEAEVREGRRWAITPDVIARELVCALGATSLSARTVSRERVGSSDVVLEWPSEGTSVRIIWSDVAAGTHLDPTELRRELRRVWESLDAQAQRPTPTKICLLVAPDQVHSILGPLINENHRMAWKTLSLTEADRLGIPLPEADLRVRALASDRSAPVAWYQVK